MFLTGKLTCRWAGSGRVSSHLHLTRHLVPANSLDSTIVWQIPCPSRAAGAAGRSNAGHRRSRAAGSAIEPASRPYSAKIIGETGEILGARIFDVRVPASITDEAAVAAALNEAFRKAVTDLVVWTLKSV